MIFDMFFLQGTVPIAMAMTAILYLVFLTFILSKGFHKNLIEKVG